jgi:hypothetical protein
MGSDTVVILNLELMLLSANQARGIQQAVSDSIGIDIDSVWVFVTHNHAGPATLESYQGDCEDAIRSYCQELPLQCVAAAKHALASLVPVRFASASGTCHIGVNRDLPLDNGSFVIAPNPQGFSDPEVGIIKIDNLEGQTIAVIANYSCHPTIAGHENKLLSPDYPGVTRKLVEQVTGATCVFLQGAAGNVGPQEGFTSDLRAVERQGAILGCEVAKITLETKTLKTETVLQGVVSSMSAQLGILKQVVVEQGFQGMRVGSKSVKLPTGNDFGLSYHSIDYEILKLKTELEELVHTCANEPDVINKSIALNRLLWIQARGQRMLANGFSIVDVKVLCLGDIALVGTWGEMFSETGYQIKRASPFRQTLVAAYMGGDAAYLPLKDNYTSAPRLEVMNTPIAPGGAELLQEAIIELLNELHAECVPRDRSY